MSDYVLKSCVEVNAIQKLDLDSIPACLPGEYQESVWTRRNEKSQMKLIRLQETIFAEQKHKVLVIFQAMDAGGKDGVIRHLFTGLDPQGAPVASFKEPTTREESHDFLWRVHAEVPGNGEIVVFNHPYHLQVVFPLSGHG